jgi:VIT1/CCC1 family predicted Fe2+/Mn2+ transporter/enoyl-CoA hydratase/carnithine racemase
MMTLTDEARTIDLSDQTSEELVVVERARSRATVTLNDPVTRNALSLPLAASLHHTLHQLVDVPDLQAIVLTGAGGAFSSGAGRGKTVAAESKGSVETSTSALRWELGEIVRLIARSDIPFVAAVNGVATGAGLALALACDVVIVSDRARLAPDAGRVGLLSEVGMSWLLTRRLGYYRTLSLLTQGRELSATQAARAGLVEAAVEHDELAAEVSFWCEIAGLAATRRMAKPLVRSATESARERAEVMGEFLDQTEPAGHDLTTVVRDRRTLPPGVVGSEDVPAVATDLATPDPSVETSRQPSAGRSEIIEHRKDRSGALRAGVFGMSDGLVSNTALVMGLAGSGAVHRVILLAGVAGLAAGALSMAAGEYVSMASQREMYEREISLVAQELEERPKKKRDELVLVYRAKGLGPADAERLADRIMADRHVALDTLAREELGLDPTELGSPLSAAVSSKLTFAAGAFVVILPYFIGGGTAALIAAIALVGAALLGVGAGVGMLNGRSPMRSGLRQLLLGGVAALVTFGIGHLIGASVS